jgi:hypothetical protein
MPSICNGRVYTPTGTTFNDEVIMVAFARNLTGITEIRGPKLDRNPKQRPKHTAKRNPLDRGFRMPTREMKLHIDILTAWLANPGLASQLSKKDKEGMQRKLDFYCQQVSIRAAHHNRPLSATELTKKLSLRAHEAQRNGIRVQLSA